MYKLVSVLVITLALCLVGSSVGANDPCCVGRSGNVDCDPGDMVDGGDLSALIDNLFISLTPVCCEEEADMDGNGSIDGIDLSKIIDNLFINMTPLKWCDGTPPLGTFVGRTNCKSFPGTKDSSPNLDCIEYQYDGNGTLQLTHVNAGFNCCPGIEIEFDISDFVITIDEIEVADSCLCLCLFDLDYQIENLPSGIYTISVNEPYVTPEDEKLEFTVDFTGATSGQHCVERVHYPWGMYARPTAPPLSGSLDETVKPFLPDGTFLDRTGCKSFTGEKDASPNLDCIEYQYDGNGTLQLTHVNAGFNCCPGIEIEFDISDFVITIDEIEVADSCFCLCLFDLDYQIDNLPPGVYTVSVNEPYVTPEEEKLEFTVDLTGATSGQHCVERTHYPWEPLAGATGWFQSMSQCKEFTRAKDEVPTDQDCLEWSYDGSSFLSLTHINAGFNCCPELAPVVTVDEGVITIEEVEVTGACDCNCLFDLYYEILNLTPGEYLIRVVEPYAHPEEDPLEFTVNLLSSPAGVYCVSRNFYPWGL